MASRSSTSLLLRSNLARRTALLNLLGLLVLVFGALALNDIRKGLVDAKVETLAAQADLMAGILADVATVGDPEPRLEPDRARVVLQRIPIPQGTRVLLYDRDSKLLADSGVVVDHIEERPLPPIDTDRTPKRSRIQQTDLEPENVTRLKDVNIALMGERVAAEHLNEARHHVASVAIPVQRVQAVVGVLVIESGDIDAVIAAERRSLIPFILVSIIVTLVSSAWMAGALISPLARLAHTADAVRLGRQRRLLVPGLNKRSDEIGDLARALEGMTGTLTERADATAKFAADVVHEIKNPLASIHSAAETLSLTKDEDAKARLLSILRHDVTRIDRLISDILDASRLDAQMAGAPLASVAMDEIVSDVVGAYGLIDGPQVTLTRVPGPLWVRGLADPLARVLRNLIDNAISFSPLGGVVRVSLKRDAQSVTVSVEDDGPGIPPDSLKRVFERFYTHRPNHPGARKGHSGLGLAIANHIITVCGGRMWAENGAKGARFTFVLPLIRT